MARRKQSKKPMRGMGWWDDIKSGFSRVHDFVKDNKLASKIAREIPLTSQFADAIDKAGYGMKKKRRSIRRR